jgi:hypothetical protein
VASMFAKPTINDFLDNVRWHIGQAVGRINKSIARIKAEHAARGILQSGTTFVRSSETVKEEFDATIRIVVGELKRVARITDLDPKDLRQATAQCLDNFCCKQKRFRQLRRG